APPTTRRAPSAGPRSQHTRPGPNTAPPHARASTEATREATSGEDTAQHAARPSTRPDRRTTSAPQSGGQHPRQWNAQSNAHNAGLLSQLQQGVRPAPMNAPRKGKTSPAKGCGQTCAEGTKPTTRTYSSPH